MYLLVVSKAGLKPFNTTIVKTTLARQTPGIRKNHKEYERIEKNPRIGKVMFGVAVNGSCHICVKAILGSKCVINYKQKEGDDLGCKTENWGNRS